MVDHEVRLIATDNQSDVFDVDLSASQSTYLVQGFNVISDSLVLLNPSDPATLSGSFDGADTDISVGGKSIKVEGAQLFSNSFAMSGSINGDILIGNAVGGNDNDLLISVLGGNHLVGGSGNDIYVIGDGDSGITLPTADSIHGFTTGSDKLSLGLVGDATVLTGDYVESGAAASDFAAALTAANVALVTLAGSSSATTLYAFQFDAVNGYLFEDIDGNGSADQVIILVGIDNTGIVASDIIA